MLKRLFLKLFSTKDLVLEIEKREWRFPPNSNGKDWNNFLRKVNRQFPEIVDLLKLREYNLAQTLVISEEKDRNMISARMAEVKYWQIKFLNPIEYSFQEELTEKERSIASKELKKRESGIKKFVKKLGSLDNNK